MTERDKHDPIAPLVFAPQRLKKRPEFLFVAGGKVARRPAFVLQARRRMGANAALPRVGFTATKKTGNAVERNRIKRRLRELVRLQSEHLQPDCDYVLIGRRAALDLPFKTMSRHLDSACRNVHKALAEI